jgi:membrane dipeptidase
VNNKPIARRKFLAQCVGATMASSSLFSKPAQARHPSLSATEFQEAKAFLAEHFVADLHTHPSLKTSFLGKDLTKAHAAPSGTWPFTMRGDIPSLKDGQVDAIVSVIYPPEREFLEDSAPLRAVSGMTPSLRKVKRSMAQPSDEVVVRELEAFEKVISESEGDGSLGVARSVAEMDRINAKGGIAILHGVEGGHSLGCDIGMVDELHSRGVCMLTIAHFYDRGVAPNVMGLPDRRLYRAFHCFQNQIASEKTDGPLPKFGKEVVDRMLSLGMIVDLSHCAPTARREATAMAHRHHRPVVMSHVGHHGLAPFKMNPKDDEVCRIADTGGVIGVIFMNYFLNGKIKGKGIDAIVMTVEKLIDAGGVDCIGWGSDFDGLTNPPNDLREPSDLPYLAAAMLKRFGAKVSAKFFGGNARRLLEDGWSPATGLTPRSPGR